MSVLSRDKRLVVAHLALRQCHDRLQIKLDLVGFDGVPDHGNDAGAVEARKRCGRCAGRPAQGGIATGGSLRRRARSAPMRTRRRPAPTGVAVVRAGVGAAAPGVPARHWSPIRDETLQSGIVGGNRIGELLDQRGEFLDFGGERLRRRQSAVDHLIDLDLHGAPGAGHTRKAGARDRRCRGTEWRSGCLTPAGRPCAAAMAL